MTSPFVSPQWLADRLDDPAVTVLDGSWLLPGTTGDTEAEFETGHIPGAIRFDIKKFSDAGSDLPHMLPEPAEFAKLAGEAGIGSDGILVVYDSRGLTSAPRVWWTLKVMGAKDVRVLEGGLPRWRAENLPLETGHGETPPEAVFTPRPVAEAVADFERVREASRAGTAQILDARPPARFSGEDKEPRPGLKSGHIPRSVNLPTSKIVTDGAFKSAEALAAAFEAAGIDLDRPVITSCGSGVSASTLALALEVLGARDVAVYDGSWSDWGSRPDAEVETGSGHP